MPKISHLLTDSLPAVLALDGVLDNCIVRYPRIYICNDIKCQANAKEIEHFVEEGPARAKSGSLEFSVFCKVLRLEVMERDIPVSHDHSTIFECQLHGRIPLTFRIMRTLPQNRELLVEIPINKRE